MLEDTRRRVSARTTGHPAGVYLPSFDARPPAYPWSNNRLPLQYQYQTREQPSGTPGIIYRQMIGPDGDMLYSPYLSPEPQRMDGPGLPRDPGGPNNAHNAPIASRAFDWSSPGGFEPNGYIANPARSPYGSYKRSALLQPGLAYIPANWPAPPSTMSQVGQPHVQALGLPPGFVPQHGQPGPASSLQHQYGQGPMQTPGVQVFTQGQIFLPGIPRWYESDGDSHPRRRLQRSRTRDSTSDFGTEPVLWPGPLLPQPYLFPPSERERRRSFNDNGMPLLPADPLMGITQLPPLLAGTLQSQSQSKSVPAEAQTILTGSDTAPRSDGVWEAYWDENTTDIAVLSMKYPKFASSILECRMLASSSIVIYVYAQMTLRNTTPELIGSLPETLCKWALWNDLQWLANHHIVRKTLWEKLDVGGTVRPDDYECNLRGIVDFDIDVIQKRIMAVLDDRRVKRSFLDLCQSDPIPVANLFQTLIDRDNLPPESHAKLVRALARLAKPSRCYPDCLILATIRRTGTDPVAGGGFADVWKGYFADKPVALKALRIYKQSLREKVLKEFSHEAVIWRQLKHPNILPFYGVFKGDEHFDRLCLVSPWMDAGNVIDYLNTHPEGNRLSLLSDVAQGLEYLHLFRPPIIHGDLKGVSFTFGPTFSSPSLTACLGDFGLARFHDSQGSTLGATTGHTTGTLRWQAPELLSIYGDDDTVPRSEECDVYSFGCVCLELMTGKPPFMEIRKDGAVMRAILDRQTPQRPLENVLELGLDDAVWSFMEQCWNFDPALRPKTVQLVEHFRAHQREANSTAETNADVSQRPRASLDQYGFPDHFVLAV
ncbi:kinase-like protein [Rickenella mellea]|uniref:Kinase-like protein n=1 Tax=Rickenella mellea TaxID=50990 RepID=A0A4Y7PJE1_9AGAM|nr:kinase-like protein [Rickenella mellea]